MLAKSVLAEVDHRDLGRERTPVREFLQLRHVRRSLRPHGPPELLRKETGTHSSGHNPMGDPEFGIEDECRPRTALRDAREIQLAIEYLHDHGSDGLQHIDHYL